MVYVSAQKDSDREIDLAQYLKEAYSNRNFFSRIRSLIPSLSEEMKERNKALNAILFKSFRESVDYFTTVKGDNALKNIVSQMTSSFAGKTVRVTNGKINAVATFPKSLEHAKDNSDWTIYLMSNEVPNAEEIKLVANLAKDKDMYVAILGGQTQHLLFLRSILKINPKIEVEFIDKNREQIQYALLQTFMFNKEDQFYTVSFKRNEGWCNFYNGIRPEKLFYVNVHMREASLADFLAKLPEKKKVIVHASNAIGFDLKSKDRLELYQSPSGLEPPEKIIERFLTSRAVLPGSILIVDKMQAAINDNRCRILPDSLMFVKKKETGVEFSVYYYGPNGKEANFDTKNVAFREVRR